MVDLTDWGASSCAFLSSSVSYIDIGSSEAMWLEAASGIGEGDLSSEECKALIELPRLQVTLIWNIYTLLSFPIQFIQCWLCTYHRPWMLALQSDWMEAHTPWQRQPDHNVCGVVFHEREQPSWGPDGGQLAGLTTLLLFAMHCWDHNSLQELLCHHCMTTASQHCNTLHVSAMHHLEVKQQTMYNLLQ